MSARVDPEEIHATKSEKLLAVVLAVFLLIGGIWTYQRLDDWARAAVDPSISSEDRAAVDQLAVAGEAAFAAKENERRTLEELTVAREAYRTALDANQPAAGLRLEYEQRQAVYADAQAATREAKAEVAEAEVTAAASQRRIAIEQRRASGREGLLSFALRLVFVVGAMSFGYWLLANLRRRGSRSLPLGLAFVGFAAILAFVLAGDYVTDYVDPLDLGPLVLALVGIALTLAAFRALQKYLARRIPLHRVRKGECPFCGYPVHGNERCEGCGREVLATCAQCANPRRVGALHCGACGQV
jgi:hypothetical protein